ncbi:MAG: sulfatase, partial [Armatimonadetes bacterium]|nr:sulfatase [Armatimonadota bacterium]
ADRTRVLYTSDHGENLGARGLFGKFTMYEESVSVPLLLAGPEVPAGRVVPTPVSLVDCFPTLLEAVGARPDPADAALPGTSLWRLAVEESRDREVLSEYHAVNSRRASFMLRGTRWKLVYYVDAPPQLFDLETDPQELRDRAADPDCSRQLAEMTARLRERVDPEGVDRQARADQAARIAAYGGREAVLRRGTFDNSPVPGEKPAFRDRSLD